MLSDDETGQLTLVGLLAGNEMLGGAALLIIIGCSLFRGSRIET